MIILRRHLVLWAVLILTLSMSACAPEAGGTKEPLAGTRWRLTFYGSAGAETTVIEGTELTLDFEADNEVTGSAGCNDFAAQYVTTDASIVFSQIVSTEIFCSEGGVMDQEEAYLEALETAGTFERTEDELRIWYGDGQRILNFVSADGS